GLLFGAARLLRRRVHEGLREALRYAPGHAEGRGVRRESYRRIDHANASTESRGTTPRATPEHRRGVARSVRRRGPGVMDHVLERGVHGDPARQYVSALTHETNRKTGCVVATRCIDRQVAMGSRTTNSLPR